MPPAVQQQGEEAADTGRVLGKRQRLAEVSVDGPTPTPTLPLPPPLPLTLPLSLALTLTRSASMASLSRPTKGWVHVRALPARVWQR